MSSTSARSNRLLTLLSAFIPFLFLFCFLCCAPFQLSMQWFGFELRIFFIRALPLVFGRVLLSLLFRWKLLWTIFFAVENICRCKNGHTGEGKGIMHIDRLNSTTTLKTKSTKSGLCSINLPGGKSLQINTKNKTNRTLISSIRTVLETNSKPFY